jgi:hypothetical protein
VPVLSIIAVMAFLRGVFCVERHANGPRVYVASRRVHEFQVGLIFLVAAIATAAVPADPFWAPTGCEAGLGLWLVVKDWPDLFPSTRDTACWRMGVHRPPWMPWAAPRENERPAPGEQAGQLVA